MKKSILYILLCLVVNALQMPLVAQNNDAQKRQLWDEMKSKRAAYFTQRIGLTPSEAQAFWPVYDELQRKKGELHNNMMAQFRSYSTVKDGKHVFDFAKANENLIAQKFQEARLEKIYFEKFKTILSPEKVFKYYAAEREWAGKLLKDLEKKGPK